MKKHPDFVKNIISGLSILPFSAKSKSGGDHCHDRPKMGQRQP
jgi:hypothetical protein